VEEILKLNYNGHCIKVLVCSSVKARIDGPNTTVKRDEYGFTLAKLPLRKSRIGAESFAFSINIQQVYFFNDDSNPNWKVVCHVDVHSRKSLMQFAVDDSKVSNIGHDADFLGLRREFGNNNLVLGNAPDLEIVTYCRCKNLREDRIDRRILYRVTLKKAIRPK
jgi:hypothetical protein